MSLLLVSCLPGLRLATLKSFTMKLLYPTNPCVALLGNAMYTCTLPAALGELATQFLANSTTFRLSVAGIALFFLWISLIYFRDVLVASYVDLFQQVA